MIDASHKRAIGDALGVIVGVQPRLVLDEVDGGQTLCVWEFDSGVAYALTLRSAGFRRAQLSLGVQRGREPVETCLDETYSESELAGLLRDPGHLAAVFTGQRSGRRFSLELE